MKNALHGLRVLDLTMNLPGPYMTWLMAEMDAEVVKVENPDGGDPARAFMDPGEEIYFPLFEAVNRGKKSVTLDLKVDGGRSVFKTLLGGYDILVEGFRPGVMKTLGLDYESLSSSFPNLLYVSITG
ncbi:CoA-transferase family III [Desulfocicer vacuolatum DSM 3385]|uniref:CoA-transferase family III n=1 Tax=Desulfocicer vacuolatum DSM 3385 TaxID=1121400 RepID=A0A1W2ETB5_9BACT|nr:CoA transferase [Desulfocicer vacuolatum]SMD12960.1 CoA-transferase family III [Desulfocicer vacuolatum DSM 3385]